jgi:phage-related protein
MVVAGAPFTWTINDAALGTTWNAAYSKQDGTALGSTNGVVGASESHQTEQQIAAGAYSVLVTLSDGTAVRFPLQSIAEYTFVWQPDFEAARAKTLKIKAAQFGDGYAQRSPDGLNANVDGWDLNFANITDVEADQIMLFLDAMGGVKSFKWKNPDGVLRRYICTDYGRTYGKNENNTVRAKFVQSFN